MSMTLRFVTKAKIPPDWEAVVEWGRENENIQVGKDEMVYHNALTGVEFHIYREQSDLGFAAKKAGYRDAGIVMHVNFTRPCYFAMEFGALAEELWTMFDLAIQPFAFKDKVPRQYKMEQIADEWIENNDQANTITDALLNPPQIVVPRPESISWWSFVNEQPFIARYFPRDHIPPYVLVMSKKTGDIVCAAVWLKPTPIIIPPTTSLVLIQKGETKGGEAITGFITMEQFMETFDEYFYTPNEYFRMTQARGGGVYQMCLKLDPHKLVDITARYETLELKAPCEEYETISTASYIDTRLPHPPSDNLRDRTKPIDMEEVIKRHPELKAAMDQGGGEPKILIRMARDGSFKPITMGQDLLQDLLADVEEGEEKPKRTKPSSPKRQTRRK